MDARAFARFLAALVRLSTVPDRVMRAAVGFAKYSIVPAVDDVESDREPDFVP